MDYNDLQYVYWLSSLTTMYIDHGHFLTKLLGSLPQNDWWHIPCIAGPALGNQQSSRRIPNDSNASKGAPCLEVQLLRDLLLQQISWQHGHRVVAIFLKTKSHKARQARLTFNCDGSIQGTSQQPKLFGFIFLAMSSVQLWRSSGAWDLFKATPKKTNAAGLSCIFRSWVIEAVMELTKDL